MRVLIVKRYERELRIPFYQLLKEKLSKENIHLDLVYGEPDIQEKKSIKDYIKDERIGKKVRNIYIKVSGVRLCYQPCLSLCHDSDLIIVQQGNRELFNYLIIFRRLLMKKPKIAFWGHGKNFQGDPRSFKERFKKWYSNKVDFWFAYNDLSKKIMIERGFKEANIEAVNNTIDTKSQIEIYNNITKVEKSRLKQEYLIEPTDPIGIFCASIYKDKQISFLLNSLEIVKSRVQNLKYFVIGKGEEDFKILEYSKKNVDWFFYLGNKFDRGKILFFSIADFQTIPGAVGLNIIDSFMFLCPLITTNINNHGPEISYLINNDNGIMTRFNVEDYANSIINLISDNFLKKKLMQGCKKAREIYSIDNMVNNYFNGILKIIK
jgi:glycosyltransferase involved in cell wall biosynthesis